jgi:hypothetical protein
MENPNPPTQSRDGSAVNDPLTLDLSTGLRAFLGEITTEASPLLTSDSLPPAPIGPRKGSKIETTQSVESPETSPQLELEV